MIRLQKNSPKQIPMRVLDRGQYAEMSGGSIGVRTLMAFITLDGFSTYTDEGLEQFVTPLPPGSILTIEVER